MPSPSPGRWRQPTRRASSIATSSRATSWSARTESSKCSISAWPSSPRPKRAPTTRRKPGRHTPEGTIVGTAAYMSPEQAQGKPVDARSDIFSFGAMLYEMISGRRAFQGDNHMSTLAAILEKEPGAARRTRFPHPARARARGHALLAERSGAPFPDTWPICESSWKISRRSPIRGN